MDGIKIKIYSVAGYLTFQRDGVAKAYAERVVGGIMAGCACVQTVDTFHITACSDLTKAVAFQMFGEAI